VLPAWLAHPSIVSADIRTDRVRLTDVPGLDPQMVQLLRENGIKKFFPGEFIETPLLSFNVYSAAVSLFSWSLPA